MAAADSNERLFALTRFRAVTPGVGDLALGGVYPRAIMVDVAGTVTFVGADDVSAVTQSYVAGVWHSISPRQITGGTATGITAGY